MRSRVLVGTLFGAAGGFLGHLLQEALVRHDAVLSPPLGDMMRIGALVGTMLGLAVGSVEGVVTGSSRQLLRGAVAGAAIGAIGGMFGMYIGGLAYSMALFGKDPLLLDQSRSLLDFTHSVLARAIGWTFLGAFPGLAAGAATLSHKKTLHGLFGGLIGGLLGGFAFNLVANLITQPVRGIADAATGGPQIVEIGGPSRAIGFTAIGAFTGLFIGLVEEWLKQAWVRVLAGRNEGRDFIIAKPLTVIGRDERADIPVFGDPSLAPQHAAIRQESGRHVLLDGGSVPTATVNGRPVQEQLLRDGDMIQLGAVRLLFREKATAHRSALPNRDVPARASSPVQMPAHLCPFCGVPKDPQGNCACSVGEAAPHAGSVAPSPAQYETPAPSAPCLVALDGPIAGSAIALSAASLTIGREAGRDLVLAWDQSVSRSHARIETRGGVHVVVDEGSSNGTFVNGVRVAEQPLAPGDVLQLGSTRLRYQ